MHCKKIDILCSNGIAPTYRINMILFRLPKQRQYAKNTKDTWRAQGTDSLSGNNHDAENVLFLDRRSLKNDGYNICRELCHA